MGHGTPKMNGNETKKMPVRTVFICSLVLILNSIHLKPILLELRPTLLTVFALSEDFGSTESAELRCGHLRRFGYSGRRRSSDWNCRNHSGLPHGNRACC